jgi:ATP-dependent RNA helicase DeaD
MNQPLVATLSAESQVAPPPPAPTFDAIPLSADVRKAIDELGYVNPTPVQLAVFEPATRGRSLVVQARTGTGKTAAFGLPIIDALIRKSQPNVQALILTPTRELALQVGRELEQLGKFRGTKITAIYGGAPMGTQIEALEGGAQVVCGTPGRVLDHLRRGTLDAKNIRILVLDEADEMLSMGFAKELNAIMEHLPAGDRQGLYFSATIPPDVDRLAKKHLQDPEYITLSSDQVGALQLAHYVYLVRDSDKRSAILNIIEVEDPQSAVVFCNTKDETERVAELLKSRGYEADWLNGDLEQKERERVMAATREGKLRFLVATDVAARGIDISHLTHVINADFPESAEQYVHRTGRTGRAGRTGTAISVVGPKDVGHLYMLRLTYKIRPIERMLPTAGEKKTRAEADIVTFLADAYAGRTADPMHRAVARRLFTHDDAESIVAGLLADHLGANSPADPVADAAEARRAKNPPPLPVQAPPREAREAPRRDGRDHRDRGPRRDELRGDASRTLRVGEQPSRPREGAGTAGSLRDGRGSHRFDRPREVLAGPSARGEAPRGKAPGGDGSRTDSLDAPRGDGPRRGDRGRGRPDAGRGGPPRDGSREGVRRDIGMGPRPIGDAPRAEAQRDRARVASRQGVPQAMLSDWEPPADEDDDHPILAGGARRPDDDSVDTHRHPRLPRLPGITEGTPTAPRREGRGAGRGPTRQRERARGERPAGVTPVSAMEHGEPREREPRKPDALDDASLSNIFLNVGRRDGVSPEDLQRLLADAGGIPPSETGNIRVRDRITFVTLKKELADRAIKTLAGQIIGGRTVVAEPARDKA